MKADERMREFIVHVPVGTILKSVSLEADYFEIEDTILTFYTTNLGRVAAFSSWTFVEDLVDETKDE